MNEKNLKSNSERTPSELCEQARKGGIASGKARRERKILKERLLLLAEQGIKNSKGEELPREDVIALQVINRAIAGDLKAIRLYAELTGQLTQQVELQQAVPVIVRDDGLD